MSSLNLLVVDDEEEIVDLYREIFKRYNGRFFTRPHEIAEEDFLFCDLLFTDFKMPNLTGGELIEEMYCWGIERPVIIHTGFVSSALSFKSFSNIINVLEKPCDIEVLHQVIGCLGAYSKDIQQLEKRFLKDVSLNSKDAEQHFRAMKAFKNTKQLKTKMKIDKILGRDIDLVA